mgnify:CR=1 FL=1
MLIDKTKLNIDNSKKISERLVTNNEINSRLLIQYIKKYNYNFTALITKVEDNIYHIVYKDKSKFNLNLLFGAEEGGSFTRCINKLVKFEWSQLSNWYSKVVLKGKNLKLKRGYFSIKINEDSNMLDLLLRTGTDNLESKFLYEFFLNIFMHGSNRFSISEVVTTSGFPCYDYYMFGSKTDEDDFKTFDTYLNKANLSELTVKVKKHLNDEKIKSICKKNNVNCSIILY